MSVINLLEKEDAETYNSFKQYLKDLGFGPDFCAAIEVECPSKDVLWALVGYANRQRMYENALKVQISQLKEGIFKPSKAIELLPKSDQVVMWPKLDVEREERAGLLKLVDELSDKNSKLKDEVVKCPEEIARVNAEHKEEIESLNKCLKLTTDQLESVNRERSRQMRLADKLTEDNKGLTKRLANAIMANNQLQNEHRQNTAVIEQFKHRLRLATEQQQVYMQEEANKFNAVIDGLKHEVEIKSRENSELSSKCDKAVMEKILITDQNRQHCAVIEQLNHRLSLMSEQHRTYAKEQTSQFNKTIEHLERIVKGKTDEVARCESEILSLNNIVHQLQGEKKDLQDSFSNERDQFIKNINDVSERVDNDFNTIKAQLFQSKTEERRLGSSLQICRDINQQLEAKVDSLKKRLAHFESGEQVKNFQAKLEGLQLERESLLLRISDHEETISQLLKQIQGDGKAVLTKDKRLVDQLSVKCEKLLSERTALAQQYQELQDENQRLKNRWTGENASEEGAEQTQLNSEAGKRAINVLNLNDQLVSENGELKRENENLLERIEQTRRLVEEQNEKIRKYESYDSLEARFKELQAELDKTAKANNSANESKLELLKTNDELLEKNRSLSSEIESLHKQKNRVNQRNRRLNICNLSLKKEIQKKEIEIIGLRDQLRPSSSDASKLSGKRHHSSQKSTDKDCSISKQSRFSSPTRQEPIKALIPVVSRPVSPPRFVRLLPEPATLTSSFFITVGPKLPVNLRLNPSTPSTHHWELEEGEIIDDNNS